MSKKSASFIPPGHNVVSPYLTVADAQKIIDFAKKVFDAELLFAHGGADGEIRHAEVRIGDTVVMIGRASDCTVDRASMLHVYVKDVDATYEKALAAGGRSVSEPSNQIYGDRSGGVEDGHGTTWWIATRVEDVPEAELAKRMKEMYAAKR
jgi:uncharacterized glyoxalase superfamily protein PhnB